MDHSPTSYTIDKLVTWVEARKLALPDFQRDFVWNPSKVAELLDSISRGWPVGSLLVLEGPQPFQAKPLDAAPKVHQKEVEKYILDGQQRVTALYHAVTDVSDIVYYVDFDNLDKYEEDYINWMRRTEFDQKYPDMKSRARGMIAKVREVYNSELFYQWQSAASNKDSQIAARLRERHLTGLRSQVYKVSAILLESEIDLEALARIFETINRTGVRLNAFDLMVAVLYPHDFNLREEWELAKDRVSSFREFEVDGVEILKLIALQERDCQRNTREAANKKVRGVRQGDVLAVPPTRVKESWSVAISLYEKAIKMLVTKLGITNEANLPSAAMLLTLAYALSVSKNQSTIKKWYWSAIARQTYAQGANTRVVQDADAFRANDYEWLHPPTDKDSLSARLLEPVRRNRIVLCGIIGALAKSGARDPLRPEIALSGNTVVARPLAVLAKGQTKSDSNSPIADLVFMTERSARDAAAEVRNGVDIWEVLDVDELRKQGIVKSKANNNKSRAARASFLAGLVCDQAGVQRVK